MCKGHVLVPCQYMTVMYWCVRDIITVMYWYGTRPCPLHTNTSLSCTGTVQERVPYTPIHHCYVLARYKKVSLTHQYITGMYWHGTRTCPLHTNTSLSCTGTVQERVPYTPLHHCHVLARYKNVSLTHQYITVMYWHGTRTCPLHTNTSLSCTHFRVPCQYMTVMYWCVRDTFLYRAST
jgi:hypothetical protein